MDLPLDVFPTMHSAQPPTLIDGKLPVFVFPSNVNFYTDDQSSHKQVLTVYNPYEFTLKFKVLCTSPKKYMVVDSEGVIKSKCCIDIVLRHLEVGAHNEGYRDKFRIQIFEHGKKKVMGKKDIIALLQPTRDKNPPSSDENFESYPTMIREDTVQRTLTSRPGHSNSSSAPSLVVIIAAVTCILALMLPNYGETETRLPEYMHLTQNQKLIAAYVLGLVTMVLLRT